MKEINFEPDEFPKMALLIKESACYANQLKEHYVDHIPVPVVGFSLEYAPNNKVTASDAKEYLNYLLPKLVARNIDIVYVADASYFKVLVGKATTEKFYGYVMPCAIKGFEHLRIIYGVNYQALFHNPKLSEKLELSMKTLLDYLTDAYSELGEGIIHSGSYPDTVPEILKAISQLHNHDLLSCDIETYGLDLERAIPATISFAWDKNNGLAFETKDVDVIHALVQFFSYYKGTLIFHNASFDIRCIIYHWFMQDSEDYTGMLWGLDAMYRSIHDTKLLAYLATNSTAGNELSLKHCAFEFAGNYAQEDIDDIRKIPMPELLEYNLVDALATQYVYDKYLAAVIEDNQWSVYKDLFIPALKNVTHMELIGMPLDMDKVNDLSDTLTDIYDVAFANIQNSQWVKDCVWAMQTEAFTAKNQQLKRKFKPLDEFKQDFLPSSSKQVRKLLYQTMKLPHVDYTKTGQLAVGSDTLDKLIAHLMNQYGLTDDDINP